MLPHGGRGRHLPRGVRRGDGAAGPGGAGGHGGGGPLVPPPISRRTSVPFHNLGNALVRSSINRLFKSDIRDIMTGVPCLQLPVREELPGAVQGVRDRDGDDHPRGGQEHGPSPTWSSVTGTGRKGASPSWTPVPTGSGC